LPHFAAGISIQQLTANARKIRTWVQNGVKKRLPALLRLLILDQSRLRFINPMPPKPDPMKFAVAFLGATKQFAVSRWLINGLDGISSLEFLDYETRKTETRTYPSKEKLTILTLETHTPEGIARVLCQ